MCSASRKRQGFFRLLPSLLSSRTPLLDMVYGKLKTSARNGFVKTQVITELQSHTCLRALEPLSRTAREPYSDLSLTASHATHALHDSAFRVSVLTLEQAAKIAINEEIGENCCWVFARAIKAFERDTKKRLKGFSELRNAFYVWWSLAKDKLPEGADFEEYQDDFVQCYRKVATALGENTIENVMLLEASERDILFYGPKKAKLVAACRELQRIAGDNPFFLSVRDAARIMSSKDPYGARNGIAALIEAGALTVAQKGTLNGKRATRYRFREVKA